MWYMRICLCWKLDQNSNFPTEIFMPNLSNYEIIKWLRVEMRVWNCVCYSVISGIWHCQKFPQAVESHTRISILSHLFERQFRSITTSNQWLLMVVFYYCYGHCRPQNANDNFPIKLASRKNKTIEQKSREKREK